MALLGGEKFLLGSGGRGIHRTLECKPDRDQPNTELQRHRNHPSLKYVEETSTDLLYSALGVTNNYGVSASGAKLPVLAGVYNGEG